MTCKSAFDTKLEKLANSNLDENDEVVCTVKLEISAKANSIEDLNEEVMSTAKFESSDKNDSNVEASAI